VTALDELDTAAGEVPSPFATVPRRRRTADVTARGCMLGAFGLALVPLVLVLGFVIKQGASVLSWSYFTKDHLARILCDRNGTCSGGIAPDIVGTVLVVVAATLLAAPLGLLAAVYLNEYGRGRLGRVVRFLTDVMTGVPSIIAGIFVFSVIVIVTGAAGRQRVIYNGLAGACALAVLMLPLIIRASEEMLKLVPQGLREASYALGVPRWRTIVKVVLPTAASGITTAVMLAVARAAGETAPLLFTIFGAQLKVRTSLFGKTDALPLHIFTNAASPSPVFVASAWGAALTLVVITLVMTVLARLVTARTGIARTSAIRTGTAHRQ
jgi:phosphate transport system permease protein